MQSPHRCIVDSARAEGWSRQLGEVNSILAWRDEASNRYVFRLFVPKSSRRNRLLLVDSDSVYCEERLGYLYIC